MSCLLEVNDIKINVADALRSSVMKSNTFLDETISDLLVKSYCSKHGIAVSDQELQIAANELRYELSLESLDDFKVWLQERFMTFYTFQEGLYIQILKNKILHSFSDDQIKSYFLEHKLEFEKIEIYNITVSNQDLAEELYLQITEEDENFHLIAMNHSIDLETKHLGGYAGFFSRHNLTGQIEAELFKAKVGDVVGPFKLGSQYHIFKLAQFIVPSIDSQLDFIQHRLFDLLLEKVSSKASIHYHIFDEQASS
ncbi:MAG: peptidylprolyl isomerase [Candidatus Cloacimonetes bacterium]|nr:peptidylprolyl isomerase [Candidatus Cloacimonadota bacterium]